MNANCLIIFTLLLSIVSLTGCTQTVTGEGEYITQNREVQAFSEIALSVPAKVTLRQGASFKVELRAQANVLEILETKVSGKELAITSKKNMNNGKAILITITLPKLEGFEINGSGEVTSPDVFESTKVELEINGSGSFAGNFVSDLIQADITGSGAVRLKGSAGELKHETNGSGTLEAADLRSKSVKLEINGSGNCKVWAEEALESEINGSGSVLYKGSPVKLNQEINGSGTVRKV